MRTDREKFQKLFKNSAERLLLKPAQQRIFMQLLIEKRNHKKWFVCDEASQCRVSVMLVVKFYREIFYKCRFSKKSRRLLLKLPRNSQSFLIQPQIAEHQCISYRSFTNFSCVLLLSSVLTFSVLFSPHFCRDQVKMLFYICWKGNANLIGPGKEYFC